MKTFTKLFNTLLIVIAVFYTSFAQTQIGQTLFLTDNEVATALSFDGSRLVAVSNDDMRVYEFDNQWTQLGQTVDYQSTTFLGGISVSISYDGNRIAFGNPSYDNIRGQAKVYDLIGGSWTQVGSDINGENTLTDSGISISLSGDGNRIAVGARNNNGTGIPLVGHTRVFELVNGDWVQLGSDIDGETTMDISGYSVSLSSDGNRVAVGAPGNDANGNASGHARIYEFVGNDWVQVGQDIDGEYPNDESGISISLSGTGNRVAIGAPYNLGGQGHVRAYELIGGNWVQMGLDIDGESAYMSAGSSVSLSADGSRLALGTSAHSPTPGLRSYIDVYEWIAGSWLPINQKIYTDMGGRCFASISPNGNRVSVGYDRTASVFNAMINLDVELAYFKAIVQNHQTILNWSTASETNNSGFEIEHSTDGTNWQMLDFERGQGTSQNSHIYTYTHETPSTGINYYRLKQVDFDGGYEYSDIVSIHIYGRDGVEVFPNPTFGEISISGMDYEELIITNILGKTVFNITAPQPNIDISHLFNGTYFIQLRQENTHFIQKIVKE